jgi:cytidylate kinase
MLAKGMNVQYEDVLADMKVRDYNDSHRAVAPLVPAKDAIMVDTTEYTLDQSIEKLINIVKEHL